MPTILLIRHGQASYGAADYDRLSERGIEQARAVGGELRERGIVPARVITGRHRRQIETATAAAGDNWPGPEVDDRWDEFHAAQVLSHHSDSRASLESSGDQQSPMMSTAEFQKILDVALVRWVAAGEESPALQSWPAFGTAGGSAMEQLSAELGRGETAAVFTSAGVIASACAAVLEHAESLFVPFNRVQVNASISKIVFGASGASLLGFNDHGYLERLGRSMITYR